MIVDNLTLEKQLGKGAFGEVYLTTKKGIENKKFATKKIDREVIEQGEAMKYLKNEIIILQYLNHPNIVKFFSWSESQNNYYLATEYVNGGDLAMCLKKYKEKYNTPFPENIVKYLMKQILDALNYMHKNKIVHRDLKLDNIMVNFDNPKDISGLDPSYTFDNFIVTGNSTNFIAKRVSMSVAEKPFNNTYNPVFIYGGVGLGKTHLLNAIGNNIRKKFPEMNVFYMQTSVFMDKFINNITSNNSPEFRQFYCSADVVLLDDIQFLNGKQGTQDILFHIFNTLYHNHKQIVFKNIRFRPLIC